ncbi:hypothetical protein HMPREF0072_1326 [Anaerococcus lactolyticus ATCC 51172]|uniref:Uncharacterized protein n=1 Tax=Anaerococcus lactolyticus ATCC 51172 TaxID=525254 RepID=C2BG56_9FIRM|nr:hypothetical protein [Anaerococcus lactolyticus]EEI86171.1 hypothetical protein HMPREF0072_1326 [Anaerococcus lactolyticus ATCC 51172]
MITSITIASTRDKEKEVESFFYKLFKEKDKDKKKFTYIKLIQRRGDTAHIHYVVNDDLGLDEEEMKKNSFINFIVINKEDKAIPDYCLFKYLF